MLMPARMVSKWWMHVPGKDRLVGCQDREKCKPEMPSPSTPSSWEAAGGGTGSSAEIGLFVHAEDVRLSL